MLAACCYQWPQGVSMSATPTQPTNANHMYMFDNHPTQLIWVSKAPATQCNQVGLPCDNTHGQHMPTETEKQLNHDTNTIDRSR